MAVRMHHHRVMHVVTVMVTATGMLAESEAGEEDDRDDKHDPGDDGNPCRELKDPGSPVYVDDLGGRQRGRFCCGYSPHCWGFRCFTHETHDPRVNNSHRYALVR